MKRTLVEFLMIGLLSTGIAFTVNGLRKTKSLKFSKDYFEYGRTSVEPPRSDSGTHQPPASDRPASSPPSERNSADDPVTLTVARAPIDPANTGNNGVHSPDPTTSNASGGTQSAPSKPGKKLQHPYQEISFEEVTALLRSPETARGLNVFIDARDDEKFAEGHLPGAIQAFPYEFDRFKENVLEKVEGAEKIIVYCGGGDCEDSIFMCRELVESGVPEEAIHLYPGGFTEWMEKKMPIERGDK